MSLVAPTHSLSRRPNTVAEQVPVLTMPEMRARSGHAQGKPEDAAGSESGALTCLYNPVL